MEILQAHPELEELGLRNLNTVYWQLHTPQLYEQAVRRQEGFIAHLGPLVVRTGDHTGRSRRTASSCTSQPQATISGGRY